MYGHREPLLMANGGQHLGTHDLLLQSGYLLIVIYPASYRRVHPPTASARVARRAQQAGDHSRPERRLLRESGND